MFRAKKLGRVNPGTTTGCTTWIGIAVHVTEQLSKPDASIVVLDYAVLGSDQPRV